MAFSYEIKLIYECLQDFDREDFIRFCLEHQFIELVKGFVPEMPQPQLVNKLVMHCSEHIERARRLEEALINRYPNRFTKVYHPPTVLPRSANDRLQPYNFDLRNLVEQCFNTYFMSRYFGGQSLVILALRHDLDQVFESLHQRLSTRLAQDDPNLYVPEAKPVILNVKTVAYNLEELPILSDIPQSGVLITIIIEQESLISVCLEELIRRYGRGQRHTVLCVLGLKVDAQLPVPVQVLDPPHATFYDVSDFVHGIREGADLQDDLVKDIIHTMYHYCNLPHGFDFERAYRHIGLFGPLLLRGDIERIRQELQRKRHPYA